MEALKKGGILVTTLTDPSQDKAKEHGVRATRYTVEEDGSELAEIALLVTSGKVKPHVQKTYPLLSAVDALASVEEGAFRRKNCHDGWLSAALVAKAPQQVEGRRVPAFRVECPDRFSEDFVLGDGIEERH
jgi:hypothetical protein